MHGGGVEYDQRIAMLLLGCISRIIERGGEVHNQLGPLGHLVYRAVVRGMDGEPPKER